MRVDGSSKKMSRSKRTLMKVVKMYLKKSATKLRIEPKIDRNDEHNSYSVS